MPRSGLLRFVFAVLGAVIAAPAAAGTGTIGGTVTAEDTGFPLAGVVVSASWLFFGPQVVKATTDSAGHFEFTGLDTGFGYNIVAKPDPEYVTRAWPAQDCFFNIFGDTDLYYYYCTGQYVQPDSDVAGSVDFVLPRGGVVEGHVIRGDNGLPVAAAKVWFTNQVTDGAGFYRLRGVPAGQYGISMSADGLVTRFNDGQECDAFVACGAVVASPVAVAAGVVNTVDFSLTPGVSISGYAHRSSGAGPGANFAVRVHDESDPQRPYVTADVDAGSGDYRIGGLIARHYSVRFGDPADTRYLSEYYPDVPCPVDPCDRTAVTIFDSQQGQAILANAVLQSRQNISGRVIDAADQSPIAGASVMALFDFSNPWTFSWTTLSTAQTGDDGRFSLDGIAAGTAFAVRTTKTGYIGLLNDNVICDQTDGFCANPGAPQPYQVALDGSLDLGDLALTRGARVAGRVSNSQTAGALGHAWVEIFVGDVEMHTLAVDADGYYVTPPMSPGTIKLVGLSLSGAQMFDHVDCAVTCDVGLATPLPIEGTGVISGINFSISDPDAVFSSGFGSTPD